MPLTRRDLLKGIGLAAGGFGLTSLGYEHLIPFIHQPDNIIPGTSTWFATSCRECPAGCGMLMRNREARVVKCEGNPLHPISRGKLCARGQAALHGLYDPDRVRGPLRGDGSGGFDHVKWEDALNEVGGALRRRGRVAMIADLETGSLDALMRSWLSAFGSDRLLVYEPINYEGVKAAYGGVVPTYDIARCDYLISFSADFLETWISPVEFARQFALMREVRDGKRARFVYVGPRVSMTAANADEKVIVPPGAEAAVAQLIASEIGGAAPAGFSPEETARRLKLDMSQIRRIARELRAASSPLVLIGGDARTVRAVAQLPGGRAANTERPHALSQTATDAQVADFVNAMAAGQVDVLVVYRANPVYSMPRTAGFFDALKRVPTVVSLSTFMDETAERAHWVLPSSFSLESWGDYSPQPGIVNLMQPTMGTLFDTRQIGDILIQLAEAAGVDPRSTFNATTFYDYLRRRWGFPVPAGSGPDTSAPGWESLLRVGGGWPGSESTGQVAAARPSSAPTAAPAPPGLVSMPEEDEIRLYAHPHIYFYDGRNANRRWLQEMPEPMTNAAWGSWAEIHPDTARRLGVGPEDVIKVEHDDASISLPAYIWKGVAPGTVAVAIGQGHSAYGRYAKGTGVNVWPLLDVQSPAVAVRNTGGKSIITRKHGDTRQHGRDIAQMVTLGEPIIRARIAMPTPEGYKFRDFYPGHKHAPNRWAMVVDMNRCIGCNACVVACYAENNVPIVGADGVRRRRHMQWLRIDPYFEADPRNTPVIFQPMLCQHCDNAPCESVCPVYAAAHSEDGVNMQIYNRCVGTRYCSNNCPYKVRRFNWFDYEWPEPLNYQLNPDVTVRSRGVMEKCTFCIQRLREARVNARRENRPIRDEEVTPACAQTCPTGVYTFGDLMNPDSKVTKLIKEDPRAYQVLESRNTKPAVIYLKRIIDRT